MRRILLFLLAFVPVSVLAQGFQVNLAGQKQIGMGHTGTALAQDGASIFFNPGAVSALQQNYLQAGISPLFFKSAFNPAGTNDVYHTKDKVATPFSGYAVWSPKGAIWKVGLGVYTPFGGLTDWGNNWEGKYVVESLNLKAIYIQPTVSVKLGENFGIGAGFVYNHGDVDLTRAIPLSDANGNDGQAELKGNGHGIGWNAGLFYDSHEGITLGASYRSKINTTIKSGDAIFTVPSSVRANFPQPNTFYASLPLPATLSFGVGYRYDKEWQYALDVNLVQWNVYKELAFDYAKNTATLQDTHSARNYKNGFAIRGGVQYQPTYTEAHLKKVTEWTYRFGGGYASTAAQDGYVTPEVPDANRYYLTGGLGYKINKQFDLDASFEFEHLMSRTQTNLESNLSGTFKSNVYIPGISLTYHW